MADLKIKGDNMTPIKKIKIGDKVSWKSQAAGYFKVKEGVVVAIVPAKRFVNDFIPPGFKIDGASGYRNHESYIVRVGNSINLNWPRVRHLVTLKERI